MVKGPLLHFSHSGRGRDRRRPLQTDTDLRDFHLKLRQEQLPPSQRRMHSSCIFPPAFINFRRLLPHLVLLSPSSLGKLMPSGTSHGAGLEIVSFSSQLQAGLSSAEFPQKRKEKKNSFEVLLCYRTTYKCHHLTWGSAWQSCQATRIQSHPGSKAKDFLLV